MAWLASLLRASHAVIKVSDRLYISLEAELGKNLLLKFTWVVGKFCFLEGPGFMMPTV